MLYELYGEVYGGVEYGQQTVHYEDTAGAREGWRVVVGWDVLGLGHGWDLSKYK